MVVSMHERIATCGSGSLRVTAWGEPADVYACSCADCQRKSGSAFTYAALYAESAVTIAGEHRTVAAGCFADPNFIKPQRLFWASRQHRWLDLDEVSAFEETQSD